MIRLPQVATLAAAAALVASALAALPARAVDGAMGFSVQVSLSAAAATRLAQLREAITVSVVWYGEPTKAARKFADEMGQIDLGTETVGLPGTGGTAVVTGAAVKVAHVDRVKNRAVNVNVNVFSARRSAPDNLLSCDLFDDALTLTRPGPVAIHCRLIGER